eukprot:9480597-Pyramimonas_sp.AAC.1
MAHDSSRWLKIVTDIPPRGPMTATRLFQVPAEPSNLEGSAKKPKWPQNLRPINVSGVLAVSLPMGIGGLRIATRWPKRAPRGAQEGPKRAPRAPKSVPRAPQEGLKTAFFSFRGGELN